MTMFPGKNRGKRLTLLGRCQNRFLPRNELGRIRASLSVDVFVNTANVNMVANVTKMASTTRVSCTRSKCVHDRRFIDRLYIYTPFGVAANN